MDADETDIENVNILPMYPYAEFELAFVDLYKRISNKDLARIFWFKENPCLELREFLNEMASCKIPFVGFNDQELVGFVWAYEIISGKQCELAGWLPFSSRGYGSESLLKMVLSYLRDKMNFPTIYIRTPWHAAHELCVRAGMEECAAIDGFHTGQRETTFYVMRSRS